MDNTGDGMFGGLMARPQPRRLSEVLAALAAGATGPVTVAAIRDALGDRSFAAQLVFFAALNLLPLPPGTSLVLGLPIVIVAVQMLFGRDSAWLPGFVLRKSLEAERFRELIARLNPWLLRLERFVKPRWWPFTGRQDDRFIGLVALIMGLAVVLPIPLGNWLPAFAVTLLGLSLSERDGILLGIGIAAGILALLVIALVIGSAGAVVGWFWTHPPMHPW